jgi:hypothetical protein
MNWLDYPVESIDRLRETDIPALLAEVRRLRALFTEEDARLIDETVQILHECRVSFLGEVPQLRQLAARIRNAIG